MRKFLISFGTVFALVIGGGSNVLAAETASPSAVVPVPLGNTSFLAQTIFVFTNFQWLELIGSILVGMILGRIARFMVAAALRQWMKRRERKDLPPFAEGVIDNAERPYGIFTTSIVTFIGLRYLVLAAAVATNGAQVLAGGILLAATKICICVSGMWAAYRLIDLMSSVFEQIAEKTKTKLDDLLVPMLRRTAKVFTTAFGLVYIAQNLLNQDVSSLVAGLGLGGLAFALAAKDTVANLFGSIMILADQPFHIGDWVVIGNAEGTVEDVGFRSTRIRTFYNSVISVPNNSVVNTQIDNLGMRTYRRCKAMLSVTYDTEPAKIEAFTEGVRELIRLHPYTRKDYFNVFFNQFAASSLDILLYVFWKVPDWTTELRERQRLFVDIMRLANRLGVEFAFPTQTLHLASTPPLAPIRIIDEAATGGGGAASGSPASEASEQAVSLPPLLTGEDFEKALELGRVTAREIVYATLGNPVRVPPPYEFMTKVNGSDAPGDGDDG